MIFSITQPTRHDKKWGYELWLVNNNKYCGKILHFNKGAKFSMHFHDIKEESQYCFKGKFILRYIDMDTAEIKEKEINEGDVINIPRLQTHQLEALEESDIFEVSTEHYEMDSYRVMGGDSQKE